MLYTIGRQFNATSGLGKLGTPRWRKSYICSRGPCAGPRQGTDSGPSKSRLPMFPLVWCEGFSHAIPAPAPCPLFPLPQAWPVNSASLPFTRLPGLSMGSAGTGGRRPVAGQRPERQHTLPPGPRHIRTSPSAPRACGLISPPLL